MGQRSVGQALWYPRQVSATKLAVFRQILSTAVAKLLMPEQGWEERVEGRGEGGWDMTPEQGGEERIGKREGMGGEEKRRRGQKPVSLQNE